jgi:NitT/TauT family transport system ATP-binding protein
MTILVRFHQIGKHFANGIEALKGFDLSLQEGDLTSFLGPSGCGKSTALRLIAGLEQMTTGTLDSHLQKHELSYVFQDATLMPWATVLENVSLPLRIRKMDKASSAGKVRTVLEKLGLADFALAYPRELSGGMRMRASIARALVTQPKVLLMDEPFAALDEITRTKLNTDLLALKSQDKLSIVFVTHSIYESVFLSDRIVVFSERPGRVIGELTIAEQGPRDEAFRTSARYGGLCREASALLQLNHSHHA